MKRCPTCQRTYQDDAPAFCVNDGARLVDEGSQPAYDPQKTILSSGPPPPPQYASPPPMSPPMQQPPPPQQPMWPPPPQGQAPQAQNWGGYQQPGQYPPYGGTSAPVAGSKALSNVTFLCGLGAFIIFVLLIVFYVMVRNGALEFSTALSIAQILQPLSYVMLIAGGASVVLGILTIVMSSKNRALSKPKAIVGMCLGVIPLIFYIIGLANMS